MFRDWGQGTSYFDGGQGARPPTATQPGTTPFTTPAILRPAPRGRLPAGNPALTTALRSARLADFRGQPEPVFSWSSTTSPSMLTDVQQWLDSPATNFGWIMLGNESAGQTAKRFGGQNAIAPETPPQLTVQYAPTWIWTGSAGNGCLDDVGQLDVRIGLSRQRGRDRAGRFAGNQRYGGSAFRSPERQPPDLRREQDHHDHQHCARRRPADAGQRRASPWPWSSPAAVTRSTTRWPSRSTATPGSRPAAAAIRSALPATSATEPPRTASSRTVWGR